MALGPSREDAFEEPQVGGWPFAGPEGGAAERMDWMETEGSEGGGGGWLGA